MEHYKQSESVYVTTIIHYIYLQSAVQNLFCLRTTDSAVHSNLLISADAK